MKTSKASLSYFAAAYALGLCFAIFLAACAKPVAESGPTGVEIANNPKCKAATDQAKSYMAPLISDSVVRAKIDSQFTIEQQNSIQRALQTWNESGNTIRQRPFFSISLVDPQQDDSPKATQDCSFNEENNEQFKISKVTSQSTWSALGMTEYNPAVTVRCYQGQELKKQIVMVNLNTQHSDERQLQSIVLHELGHALGLDHSCDKSKGSSEYLACSGLEAEHPYRFAVMFPSLKTSMDKAVTPELKESLTKNDTDRTACLYDR